MRPVVIDFETFFGDDYTLSKMTTESYIRDPRFEAHGAAIKWAPNERAIWYDGRELRWQLQQEDWSDVFLICHHTQFDGLILSHHYGVVPKMYGCTLSMGRLLLGNHLPVGLDPMRAHFGMHAKKTPYHLFRNKRWHELTPAVQEEIGDGACDEVESIWELFTEHLAPNFPAEEWDIVDEVIRMFTQPVLGADINVLKNLWEAEEAKKQNRLYDISALIINTANARGIDISKFMTPELWRDHAESWLQSADKFAMLLEAAGEEPETKTTAKGNVNYAFAKTDPYMRDYLLEHDNEQVRALAEARLGVKSTIQQTRAETYGFMAQRGPLPVYLRYAGAGTLRVSGGDGANWLNLKRRSPLRKSILAPQGYYLAPVDSSQIECRVLHYLAGGPDSEIIKLFRNKEDPYAGLASKFYNEPIYKPKDGDPRKDEMEAKRGMGKQGRLMCLGPDTKVLTDAGIKLIIDVQLNDRLWDGEEWVKHKGLVYQGERTVENYSGVEMTSDHLVSCGQLGWLPAACLRKENIQSLAWGEGLEALKSLATNLAQEAACSTLSSAADAEQTSIRSTQPIFLQGALRAAMIAQKRLPGIGQNGITAMLISVLTKSIALVCSGASPRSSFDVTGNIRTTAAEELECGNRGVANAAHSSPISSHSQDGTTRNYRSIELEIIGDMCREICASLPQNNKRQIDVNCTNSRRQSKTYDLSFAGPRNKYTILNDAGLLVVHNCGYGSAGKQFRQTAKNGLYGPPLDIPQEVADEFVRVYREDNPDICAQGWGYWAQCGRMLARLAGGDPIDWGPLRVENHRIYVGPGRLPMIYDTLEYYKPSIDELDKYKPHEHKGFWRLKTKNGWKTMWGSKLTQNICEAVSRVIVSQAMTRIKHRYGIRTLNWPYDELLLLIPKTSDSDQLLEACLAEMRVTPDWLPGIPLDAEGALGERYDK